MYFISAKDFEKVRSSLSSRFLISSVRRNVKLLRYLCNNPNKIERSVDSLLSLSWHYGLNIPLYTHFTSPIRRYPDLIVHRQLEAILNNKSSPNPNNNNSNDGIWLEGTIHRCNMRRSFIRKTTEKCQKLFLAAYIRVC